MKSRMAFGVCGFGKGIFEGHAFIVLRGSQTTPDGITNANFGVSRAANLQSVHDGFNTAFRAEVVGYVDTVAKAARRRNIHSLHCIGHSLGGALATLAADYISVNYDLEPYIYTFGSPRVGVFPLSEWHDRELYLKSVRGKSWKLLRSQTEAHLSRSVIQRWLEKDSPISFSLTNLEKLDAALNLVIYACLKSIGASGTVAIGGSLTIFDWTARIIKEGLKLTNNVSRLVLRLIIRIMQMLGMKPIADKLEASDQFIRHIFTMLHQRLTSYAQKAFDQALNKGRGM